MQHDEMVLIYDAPDQSTAEIVCATLQAAGIRATVQSPHRGPAAGMMPYLGLSDARGVLVAPTDVPAARAVLGALEPTEEELAAEEEADPMSLEEAEARVKEA